MTYLQALFGGIAIGVASAFLLWSHGRIAGISGIVANLTSPDEAERRWRFAFVAGLLGAGALSALVEPVALGDSPRSLPVLAIAGLLVGFGTRLGSGCTSGHGVCGLARGSGRSFVAVMTFLATGAITASIAGALS